MVEGIAGLRAQIRAFLTRTPADLPTPWQHLVPYPQWGRNPLREVESNFPVMGASTRERM